MGDNQNDNLEGLTTPSRILGIVILAALGFASYTAMTIAIESMVKIADLQGQINLLQSKIDSNSKELDKREPYIFKR